jgi:hypothetical protein
MWNWTSRKYDRLFEKLMVKYFQMFDYNKLKHPKCSINSKQELELKTVLTYQNPIVKSFSDAHLLF